MKLKKYIAILLLLPMLLLLAGCDALDSLLADYTGGLGNLGGANPNPLDPPLYHETGTLRSEESEVLVLCADWNAISQDGETATVTVKISLDCYAISTGKHQLTVTVNGETQSIFTRPIENQSKEHKIFPFATFTFEADLTNEDYRDMLEISAAWDFGGSDHGNEIEELSIFARISFPGGEILPSTDGSDTSFESSSPDPIKPDPDAPTQEAKGTLTSKESTFLILAADWKITSEDGKTAVVTVTPKIEFHSLSIGRKTLSVTVNGTTKTQITREIENSSVSKHTVTLAPMIFEVELKGNAPHLITLSAEWDCDHSTHGHYIDALTIDAEISFPSGTVTQSPVAPVDVEPLD